MGVITKPITSPWARNNVSIPSRLHNNWLRIILAFNKNQCTNIMCAMVIAIFEFGNQLSVVGIVIGWFACIADRHGAASQEQIQAAAIMEKTGQYFWPGLVEGTAVKKIR